MIRAGRRLGADAIEDVKQAADERENLAGDAQGQGTSGANREPKVPMGQPALFCERPGHRLRKKIANCSRWHTRFEVTASPPKYLRS